MNHGSGASKHSGRPQRTPGDLILRPSAVIAVVVVVINDRLLKVDHPSVVSGKLSDVAGLIYFPLFLVACLESVRWLLRRRPWELAPTSVVLVSILVGVVFVLIKAWHPAANLYRFVLGWVVWPVSLPGSLLQGAGIPGPSPVLLAEDVSDLLALPALGLPYLVANQVMR